jgi:DNA-binding transcriptional ArsR family regulator
VSHPVNPHDPHIGAVTAFAREVADPVRLTVLEFLATEGPQTMSGIADELEIAGPRLGNHLARLRAAHLVTVQHTGRHAVYRVAGRHVVEALESLRMLAEASRPVAGRRTTGDQSALARARSCYGHLGGRLGVALFSRLVERQAILAPDGESSEIGLGPAAADVFGELWVDPSHVARGRRQLASACLDWTERRPHLGGALGDAILDAFIDRGLLVRQETSRALEVTRQGRTKLTDVLGPQAGGAL